MCSPPDLPDPVTLVKELRAPVHTRVLKWGDDEQTSNSALREAVLVPLGGLAPALVVGADLFYDDEGNAALAATLRRLLNLSCRSQGSTFTRSRLRVLLAWQVRRPLAERRFFESLSDVYVIAYLQGMLVSTFALLLP